MTRNHQLQSEIRLIGKLAVLLCLCCFPLASINAQAPRFFGSLFFETSTYVDAVVVADFNGDGIPDIATSNGFDPGEVNILLGNGDGTFGEAQTYDIAGANPVAIAAGDFNRDGKLDLVTADRGNDFGIDDVDAGLPGGQRVSVLLGNGDGTFQNASVFRAGPLPNSVAVADFNNDGKPDIVVANDKPNIGRVTVLFGDGHGGFSQPVVYTTPRQAMVVVARDFNGDGNVDLALGASSHYAVSVLLGNGDGTFQTYQDFATSDPPDLIAVADCNGDSKLDLVTAARYAQARFSVLLGNGDGTFQAPIDTPTARNPMDLAAGDVDGDGITDVAVVVSSTIISIFKGNGEGTFKTSPLNYGAGYTVSMGDFDGNGTVDLVSASELDSEIFAGNFGIAVVPGNGDGTFQARTELVKVASTQSQTTGDVNGDGKPDIVGTNADNTVSLYLNTGDGNFPSWTDYPTGNDPEGVVIGDVNSDGIPDLVVADHADNLISVLLGNGDGTFRPRTDFATAASPKAILLSDFNNDGITDVATANQTNPGTVSILLGAGDGTFPTHQELSAGDSPQSIAKSDFNGDGKTDLVVNYNYAGGISDSGASVFLGKGDGTFRPRVDYSIDLYDSHWVAAGDINSDGKPDFVVSNYATVSVFLGNGDGTFQPHVDYPTGGSRQLLIGDFNGDGYPDVVTGTGEIFVDFGKISLLLGNGDGTFQPYSQYLAGPPSSFSAADLNDDVALDLVVSNVYDTSVSIFFNLGGSRVSLTSSENPSHAGDPVTFTATVTPTFRLAIPSGRVKFFDGRDVLGIGLLHGKEATLTVSSLTVGNHQIKAEYRGDSTFVPARSKRLTQKVRP